MLTRWRSFWRGVRHRSRFEREMDEELQFHLESRTADLIKSGLTRAQATRRARVEFGNPEAYQDRCRDARRLSLADDLAQDLRFGARSLRKNPALTLSIVASLTLSIGATTALFSVVHGVLLRPLPYPQPDRLIVFGGLNRQGRLQTAFGPDFSAWRSQCDVCEDVAASAGTGPSSISGGSEPDRVIVARVTDNLFAAMGVQPMLGRTFLPEETGRPVFNSGTQSTPITAVVLSHGLWLRRFGGDPNVVGKVVSVDGDSCPIVGVMPRGFNFPGEAQAWVPAAINAKRDNAFLRVFARLRQGTTIERARQVVQAIEAQVETEHGESQNATIVGAVPLHEFTVGAVRPSLLTFFGAVAFVLLIACANVANLLLARAATRPREFAIRTALGAGRSRLVRQLLTESVLLAMIGGVFGALLAVWLVQAFVAFGPADIPRLSSITVDATALTFSLGLSLVTGLLFGCAPIFRMSKSASAASLQDYNTRVAGSAHGTRIRQALVTCEVALTLILLIGGGLLFRSFIHLRQAPTGIDPHAMLVASVTLPPSSYRTTAAIAMYYEQALSRLAALPDVKAVGLISALPLGRNGARISGDLSVDGEAERRPGLLARKLAASGGYFRAAGIPLVKGRVFDQRDIVGSPGVAIVSEALARALWADADPIGRRVHVGFRGDTWREVIGVVGDVKHDDPSEQSMTPAVYQPYSQVAQRVRWMSADMTFVARTVGQPENSVAALRTTLASVDAALPVYGISTMTAIVDRRVTGPRFYSFLLGSFSLLALVLAAAGIYGVVAYSVNQRAHEIGIRMALGADSRSVRRLILGEGMAPVAAGILLGLPGAFLLTGALTRFVYQVSVTDPATFAAIALVFVGVALLACSLPARRATRIDPVLTLREE